MVSKKEIASLKAIGIIVGPIVKSADFRSIQAHYDDKKEFVLDPEGYVLIRANHKTKEIELGFCDKPNHMRYVVVGKDALGVYQTVLNNVQPTVSRMDHAAYLGRELYKAELALQLGLPYIQDDPLILSKSKSKQFKD